MAAVSVKRSIDSWQDRVSANKYHVTSSQVQVSTIKVTCSFEVLRREMTCFQLITGSTWSGFLCNGYKFHRCLK